MSRAKKRTFHSCDYDECDQRPTFPKEVQGIMIRLCAEHFNLIQGDDEEAKK